MYLSVSAGMPDVVVHHGFIPISANSQGLSDMDEVNPVQKSPIIEEKAEPVSIGGPGVKSLVCDWEYINEFEATTG